MSKINHLFLLHLYRKNIKEYKIDYTLFEMVFVMGLKITSSGHQEI